MLCSLSLRQPLIMRCTCHPKLIDFVMKTHEVSHELRLALWLNLAQASLQPSRRASAESSTPLRPSTAIPAMSNFQFDFSDAVGGGVQALQTGANTVVEETTPGPEAPASAKRAKAKAKAKMTCQPCDATGSGGTSSAATCFVCPKPAF